jgi:hypothetical protein
MEQNQQILSSVKYPFVVRSESVSNNNWLKMQSGMDSYRPTFVAKQINIAY